jgi:hypothetical protein
MDTDVATVGPRRPEAGRTRTRRPSRVLAVLVLPLALLVTSCKLKDVTDPITKTFEDIFGLTKDEIHTPEFEIVNGIKIQVVLRFDDVAAGVPVTVHVKCAGGTQASATVVLHDSGSVTLGHTTFQPTWPAGTDCVVSQEVVQGVDAVSGVLTWLDSNDVRATFSDV